MANRARAHAPMRPQIGLGWQLIVRFTGATLLAFAFLPIFRVITVESDAPLLQNISVAASTLELVWWGSLSILLLAFLLARLLPDTPERLGRVAAGWVQRPPLPWFAIGIGIIAAMAAWLAWTTIYLGLYTTVDEIASVIQARYMTLGLLAGPVPPLPEGWLIPNTLMVEEGWVSQYPPSHLMLMALFNLLGVPGLLGPALIGAMAALVALTLPRLLPSYPAVARSAAILTAFSPLLVLLAGGASSHLTAGAALAGVAYAAVRARDGSAWWGLAVGVAVGLAVTARPLVGLLLGTALPLALWWPQVRKGALDWGLRRTAATVAGGLPFALGLGWYHTRLFGGPTRWGYLAAFGENHGLGFHPDPWGFDYGVLEALAFTSTDLIAAGVQLLETPLPLTAVVGCLLLIAPRLPQGAGVLVLWALIPAVGNAFYWFHAPRMYFEAAPAWIALGVLAVVRGARTPDTGPEGPKRRFMRSLIGWAAVMSLGWAVIGGVPLRWSNAAWTDETLGRVTVPEVPEPGSALVFVHTSWNERLTSTLQGAGGMRQDSVTSVLRRNATCDVDRYARMREQEVRHGRSTGPLPTLDLAHQPGSPPDLARRLTESGTALRIRAGGSFGPDCARELHADRFGAVALAPLVWQGDLPGDERGRPMFVRDLGPEKNELIRAAFPGRTSWVFAQLAPDGPPQIAPYEQAMAMLWGPTTPE